LTPNPLPLPFPLFFFFPFSFFQAMHSINTPAEKILSMLAHLFQGKMPPIEDIMAVREVSKGEGRDEGKGGPCGGVRGPS
jgi:hypothetical protein